MGLATEKATNTREALIEAASALFAEKGFVAVSVREITGLAKANVASVKYHFGSREGLMDAVVCRMAEPVNSERLRRLEELEDPTVREILVAFFEPLLSQIQGSAMGEQLFMKLVGRITGDRPYEFPDEVMGQFREVAQRFVGAFQQACPALGGEDIFWRIHFSFGVLINTLTHGELLQKISQGAAGDENFKITLNRVIDFCEAGFQS